MTKIDVVRKEMMAAMKSGDRARKDALSLLLSALKSKAIDKRADLTEEEENAVVYKEIKEAKETMETTPAERTDIHEECRTRIAVWSEFAPQLMGEDEIREAIRALLTELGISAPTPRDKGKIMKPLMAKLSGKAEGKLVNQILAEFMSE